MKFFAPFRLLLPILCASAIPLDAEVISFGKTFKAIKLSMIRLGNEEVGEEAVLRPGSRYAIFKITNGAMTAHEGVWSWSAQEVR